MAHLRVVKGLQIGRAFPLEGARIVLGRHPSCQICLDNAAVSRHHAQILQNHGTFFVEDLRSRNRTLLNGAPVQSRTELVDGDHVKICDVVFEFSEHDSSFPSSGRRKGSRNETAEFSVHGDSDSVLDDDAEPSNSTILSKLDASSSSLRLDVHPEQKLRAVLKLGAAIGRSLELQEILEHALDALFELFPQAAEGFVITEPSENGGAALKITHTRKDGLGGEVRISRTVLDQALEHGEAILSADASKEFEESESISQAKLRSIMCVPLMSEDDVRRGVVQLATKGVEAQFSKDDLDIFNSVAGQVGVAIENARLHAELLRQRDLELELEFATQVQMGFLPERRPTLDGYEFHDFYESALSVGGDYFDYIHMPDGRLVLALGDVAGKGVAAALLMARLYSATRYHVLSQPSLADAMATLNADITCSGLGHRFITCVLVALDPSEHAVTIANAGHLPPAIRRGAPSDDRFEVELLPTNLSGLPLGIVEGQVYEEHVFPLGPGDLLAVFTDGVTEAMNPERTIYRSEGVARFLSKSPPPIVGALEGLVEDVERFTDGKPQRDDMCLVGLRRLP